jgi:hypothetical protein
LEWGPLEARPSSESPAGDQPGLLGHADGEAGQVVFADRIHAGHLGGLAADEGTTGQFAAPGDTGYHLLADVHIQLAAGEVVEEEEGLRALHEDVVDAHGHQVLTNGVVLVEVEGQLQLGADTIGAGDQHRLAVVLRQLHEGTEAANAAQHLGPHGPAGMGLDAFDQIVPGIDINAGIAVGKSGGGSHGNPEKRAEKERYSTSRTLFRWSPGEGATALIHPPEIALDHVIVGRPLPRPHWPRPPWRRGR